MNHNWLTALGGRRAGVLAVGLIAVSLALAGCGSKQATSPVQKMVPLTLTAQSTGAAASFSIPAPVPTMMASPTDSIGNVEVTLSKALLVVRDVRFERFETEENDSTEAEHDSTDSEHDSTDARVWASRSDSLGGEDGEVVFHGPFVIDLLSHTSQDLDTQLVPAATYEQVQGHLNPLHAGDKAATPDLSFLVGSTVYLAGTIGGTGGGNFTFEARIDDEFIIHGKFTVTTGTPATTFITFDPTKWLVGRDGRFLDPRNPDNLFAIKWAIRHSIKMGMDDNHDGRMDDDMHADSE